MFYSMVISAKNIAFRYFFIQSFPAIRCCCTNKKILFSAIPVMELKDTDVLNATNSTATLFQNTM